jgi:hypothetical protein
MKRDSEKPRHAPGYLLLKITEFLFSKKTQADIFDQLIADMREEYFEALNVRRRRKAQWVRIRGTLTFMLRFVIEIRDGVSEYWIALGGREQRRQLTKVTCLLLLFFAIINRAGKDQTVEFSKTPLASSNWLIAFA